MLFIKALIKESREVMFWILLLTSLLQQQEVLSKPRPKAYSAHNHRSDDPGPNSLRTSRKGRD